MSGDELADRRAARAAEAEAALTGEGVVDSFVLAGLVRPDWREVKARADAKAEKEPEE